MDAWVSAIASKCSRRADTRVKTYMTMGCNGRAHLTLDQIIPSYEPTFQVHLVPPTIWNHGKSYQAANPERERLSRPRPPSTSPSPVTTRTRVYVFFDDRVILLDGWKVERVRAQQTALYGPLSSARVPFQPARRKLGGRLH